MWRTRCLAAFASLAAVVTSSPTEGGVVRLSGPCSAPSGSTVTFAAQVVGFDRTVAAVRVSVAYDPARLQLLDVLSPASGPFSSGPLESTTGSDGVRFAALECATPGPEGTVPVAARLRFQVLAPTGAAVVIGLHEVVVLDETGTSLPTTTRGGSLLVFEIPDRDCDGVTDAQDNCPDVANPDQQDSNQNGTGDACDPLGVELIEFRAERAGLRGVLLTWETASETDTAGFNLYRGQSPSGPWTRLNDSLIPSAGSELTGARYEFFDRRALSGTVHYRLEDVDLLGGRNVFPPIEIRLPDQRFPDRERRRVPNRPNAGDRP